MEDDIKNVRDQWIDKFKTDWDKKINNLVSQKHKKINESELQYANALEKCQIEKAEHIAEIEIKYKEKINQLLSNKEQRRKNIEDEHKNNLKMFINSNINQETLFSSVIKYIQDYFYASKDPPPYVDLFSIKDIKDININKTD